MALLQMVLLQLVRPEGWHWQLLLLLPVKVRMVCVQTHPVCYRHCAVAALMLHAAGQPHQLAWLVRAPPAGYFA
jgi:hypothetical protein